MFVLGHDILRIAGDEAPLALGVAALLYLPVIVCLAAGAGALPAGTEPYELARAGTSFWRPPSSARAAPTPSGEHPGRPGGRGPPYGRYDSRSGALGLGTAGR